MDQAPSSPQDAQSLPSCYRHPERETGIRCTRCERPICPECMVSASVGFQCPECVRDGSGTGHAPSASHPRTIAGGTVTTDPRLLTKLLVGVNLLVFLVQLSLGDRFTDRFDLIGRAWVPELGSTLQGVAEGQWYRLLTSMFLHGSVMHIAFNMLSLWWLGGPLEAALGRARYIALYFVSGLAGGALTYLLAAPNQASLGASGAIFGLFGATAVLMRRLKYDMRPVVILLVINLIITFGWSGIAWEAHVGGLVGGVLIGYAMVHALRERRALIQYGACALVLIAAVVMALVRTTQLV
ncbi:rhomboid family intramembrane serine protease [Streptomyces ipomoeae]|jgi:membrane associated rhomboid family serine protease|uniref:rhomboid family intramembrane serine protease n=1 Tax=Streptomyces ipomoeae TaxID=103232 RepID=UPI0029B76107|nr:rhomboid family intramembrane serine protease [Streptomyces ipomoeae]MDX2823270.1 rhomboid family intramembrane serine protease [Streptomyces ipomoeae]MDX2875825.1 rhomboid family intramembrane serine protease [Streptomyces ipomoeae]